jgi:hypothetical protein
MSSEIILKHPHNAPPLFQKPTNLSSFASNFSSFFFSVLVCVTQITRPFPKLVIKPRVSLVKAPGSTPSAAGAAAPSASPAAEEALGGVPVKKHFVAYDSNHVQVNDGDFLAVHVFRCICLIPVCLVLPE